MSSTSVNMLFNLANSYIFWNILNDIRTILKCIGLFKFKINCVDFKLSVMYLQIIRD